MMNIEVIKNESEIEHPKSEIKINRKSKIVNQIATIQHQQSIYPRIL